MLLLKVVLVIMALGMYKDYTPLILRSSSFFATVYVYMHIAVLCFALSWLLEKLGIKWHREMLFTSIVLLLLLLGTETVLRFGVKTRLDYCETSGGPYRASMFEQNIDPNEVPYKPSDTVWTHKTEFNYYRVVNEQGLFEKNIPPKQPNEVRFLCLGDSFTEGVGTDYDSSWVKQVERLMQQQHDSVKITFINAGMSGNDPFGEYHLFTSKLMGYQPDWVIMMTNNSDVFDYMERGGLERFKPDGTISYRKGPWWYQAYRYSYIVRHIAHDVFHLKDFLITDAEEQQLITQGIKEISALCQTMDSLGAAEGFNFVLALQPMYYEVEAKEYNFKGFTNLLGACKHTVDIMPSMIEQVQQLSTNTPYYWPLDVHYNALGYQFVGNAVYQYLDSIAYPSSIDTTQSLTNAPSN